MRALSLLSAAILLAFGPVACSPPADGPVDQTGLQQLLRAAARQEMKIDAASLADRLLSHPEGLVLFDLRPDDAYQGGHIESASRREATGLLAGELPPERDLVLYDSDGHFAAQTAAVLRLAGRPRVFYLADGYDGWAAYVSGDTGEPAGGDVQAARDKARRAALACRFEGDYVATAGLVPKGPDEAPSGSRGYAPEVRPAEPPAEAPSDSLGLGLGLGLGPEESAPRPRGRLRIGEGC